MAERADVSRKTLYSIEQGSAGVGIGNYAMVLYVLGLEKDPVKVAEDDKLGRKLQNNNLLVKEKKKNHIVVKHKIQLECYVKYFLIKS